MLSFCNNLKKTQNDDNITAQSLSFVKKFGQALISQWSDLKQKKNNQKLWNLTGIKYKINYFLFLFFTGEEEVTLTVNGKSFALNLASMHEIREVICKKIVQKKITQHFCIKIPPIASLICHWFILRLRTQNDHL